MAENDSDNQVDEAPEPTGDDAPPATSTSSPADDAPAAVQLLKKLDGWVGTAEVALLCIFLAGMILSGVWETWAFFTKSNEAKPAELIKYSVFFAALTGAALSAQRQQLISMDIVSRLLSPRTRAVVRVITTVFSAFICIMLVMKAKEVYDVVAKDSAEKYIYISKAKGALAVTLAGLLLVFHFCVHALVDIMYLASGKVPPEHNEVSVH